MLSHAASVIAEGEVLQLSVAKNMETTEDDYLSVIRAKTAALFSAAAEVGPIIAGASTGGAQRAEVLRDESRPRLPARRRRARLWRAPEGPRQEHRRRLPRRQDHPARRARLQARNRRRAGVLEIGDRGRQDGRRGIRAGDGADRTLRQPARHDRAGRSIMATSRATHSLRCPNRPTSRRCWKSSISASPASTEGFAHPAGSETGLARHAPRACGRPRRRLLEGLLQKRHLDVEVRNTNRESGPLAARWERLFQMHNESLRRIVTRAAAGLVVALPLAQAVPARAAAKSGRVRRQQGRHLRRGVPRRPDRRRRQRRHLGDRLLPPGAGLPARQSRGQGTADGHPVHAGRLRRGRQRSPKTSRTTPPSTASPRSRAGCRQCGRRNTTRRARFSPMRATTTSTG